MDPRFELVDELGKGGMGIVYRARDKQRGGEVALKALREIEPNALLRLKREFRVMCDVRHPNLVRLGELLERDGRWFFTMELVEGVHFLEWVGAPPDMAEPSEQVATSTMATTVEPAAARATGKPTGKRPAVETEPPPMRRPRVQEAPRFDEVRLRTALRGIVEGLTGLHAKGLVHRDVKPSNIKIDERGRLVLLDFGVTVARTDADSELAGTYAYMAPEQAAGEVTPASDWYAVGVMLFRAMTGYLPFPASREGLDMKTRFAAPLADDYVRDLPRDLVALCDALLRTDPRARAGEAEVRAAIGVLLPLRAPTSHVAPFVGRTRERLRLAGLRADGGYRVALIVGQSGVGKTALARRFLDDQLESLPHMVLLESRCDERETVPFNALDGIVDGLARLVAHHRDRLPEAALDALRTDSAAELRRLFPVLTELSPPRRLQLSLDDSRAAAARALRDVLTAIGRAGPLALLIDDAQWADADSCALLADLMASPPPPLLLVVTTRGPDRPPLMAGFKIDEEIVLEGLDTEAALALATAVAANEPIDAAAIAREADGHPMFIAELSRFAAERRSAAGSLDDALWARATEASEAARGVLHAVVVDGGALSRSIAVAASGLDPDKAADAIAELRAARLIREGDDVIEPYHDRVREAVAGRLPPAERMALHLVLAHALEDSGAPPERLAHHWAGGGEKVRAAKCAELAAARAADTLAFDRAAEWLAMALSLGSHDGAARRALLVSRADALTHAGHLREAGQAFLEASRTGDPTELEQRDLRRRAAERLLSGGDMVHGLEVERALLAEVGLPWPASRGAAVRSIAWLYVRIGATRLRWQHRDEDELSEEQKLRLDTCWSAAVGLAMIDSIRSAAFAMRSLVLTLHAGDPRRIACALSAAAFAAASMNQHRRLRHLTKAIARAVTETDAPETRCYVALAESARAYFADNDWPATRDIAQRGLEMWHAAGRGHTWEVDLFEQFVGWAHATGGEHRAAADFAETVLRGARRRGDRFMEVGFRVQFPHAYLLDDRPADGVLDVDDALASWPVPEGLEQISNHFYWAWRSRAILSLYMGRAVADAATMDDARKRIERSLLWQVPAVRLDVSIWAGASSLARAAEMKGTAAMRGHIAEARRSLKLVAASPLPAAKGSVHSFRAVIAHLEGHDDKAIASLRTALPMLEAYNSVGAADAARWRLGQLVGGDEGAALIAQARTRLEAMRAVRPERMVAWGMPGIVDH
jgi:serine/threonine protein kinase